MTDEPQTQQSRRRRRFKGYRRFKVVLLSLGIAGLILGGALISSCFMFGHRKLLDFGIIYVLVSLVLLGLRGILIYIKRASSSAE